MNILEHEYLVPVVLGNDPEAIRIAKKIYQKTKIRVHVFAEEFRISQRLLFSCHKVSPMRNALLADSLLSFARSLEEYYCPVLVVGENDLCEVIERYSEEIESAFLVFPYEVLS